MMIEAPSAPQEKVLKPHFPRDMIQDLLHDLELKGPEPIMIQVEVEQ